MNSKLQTPIILLHGHYGARELEKMKSHRIWRTVDIFERQAADLFEVQNPSLSGAADYKMRATKFVQDLAGSTPELAGDWIYYPWNGNLVHCLGETDQFVLRTNRNQNLVTVTEQQRLLDSRIAIAGLSVGGGMAVALAYSGIARTMHLADFDHLETPNLNRVRASLTDVGVPKAELVARQIWDVYPYADLHLFTQGVTRDNMGQFLGADQPMHVVFDEIDDFKAKLRLRLMAKASRIPVIMLTGLGDSVLIDVERYDLEPELPIFNGLLGHLESEIRDAPITPAAARRYAAQIVGVDNVPTRAVESLLELGQTLVGRPQLASTVTIEGGLAAYLVRQVVLGAPLASGRYRLDLAMLLDLPTDIRPTADRQAALDRLLKGAQA